MRLIQNILVLLLLTGFNTSSFAAVDSFDLPSCKVFSADGGGEKKADGSKEEEEEPDCE